MASNIIQLAFNGETSATSDELVYKYDYGQKLQFTDLELPEVFEVHFAQQRLGRAVKQIGQNNIVDIPDGLLEKGSVYGWIFLHETASDGETEYEFKIPVKNRATPTDGEITPEQESVISQTIAVLVEAKDAALDAQEAAETAQGLAESAQSGAVTAQGLAEDAQEAAETAQGLAEAAQTAAESAQTASETAQGLAEDARDDAVAAKDLVLGMSATAVTLDPDEDATADYEDGLLTLGIPQGIQGVQGDTGNGIASAVLNADYTLTLTFTNGTTYTTPSIRGEQGIQGDTGVGISSVSKTSTSGLVDTYTVTLTNGQTTTFTVTNGQTGATPNISIGTVTTLDPDESATATISGTAENPILSFGIPKGDTGEVSQAELDEAVTDLKSDLITDIYNITGDKIIGFDHQKAYIPITTTADISNPIPNANFECVAIPCSAGDTFIVSASGSTPWAFIDSNNAVLTKAVASSTVIKEKLIAPSTASYLVCNNNKSVFDGVIIKADILLADDVSDLWNVADELSLTTNNLFNLSGATDGYFLNTGNDNPIANADWYYTDYLPVNPNTTYGVSRPCYVNYYDAGKAFKGECTTTAITASWGKFTTPNNASFIRISAKIAGKSTAELVVGETKPTEYLPFGRLLNGERFLNNSIPKTKVQGFGNLPYVTVEPSGNGDYTTISDAAADVSEGTTILVMPGDYEESIKTGSKTVYIVGVDKYKCRIWNSTGDYDNPPFYFASGCLKNLTIENVYDSSKDYSDVLGRPNGEYAIHIDTYPVNKKMQIDNCIIKSVWGNVFGCGARNGEVLEISNCRIIADKCTASQNMCQGFNMHGGSEGDSATVIFKNNVFVNTHNDEDIKFSISPNTQSQNIEVHAHFNIAKNVVNASPLFVHIQPDSFGNQSNILNYSE